VCCLGSFPEAFLNLEQQALPSQVSALRPSAQLDELPASSLGLQGQLSESQPRNIPAVLERQAQEASGRWWKVLLFTPYMILLRNAFVLLITHLRVLTSVQTMRSPSIPQYLQLPCHLGVVLFPSSMFPFRALSGDLDHSPHQRPLLTYGRKRVALLNNSFNALSDFDAVSHLAPLLPSVAIGLVWRQAIRAARCEALIACAIFLGAWAQARPSTKMCAGHEEDPAGPHPVQQRVLLQHSIVLCRDLGHLQLVHWVPPTPPGTSRLTPVSLGGEPGPSTMTASSNITNMTCAGTGKTLKEAEHL